MENFKDFKNKLIESLDSEYEISWKEIDTNLIGYFNSENNKYRILILDKSYDSYLIKFQVLNNSEWVYTTNNNEDTFSVMKIFSTLKKAYINFIENHSPSMIIFFSLEKGNRNVIYLRFCQSIVENYDYNYEIIEYNGLNCFMIYKDTYTKFEIMNIKDGIIDQNYRFDEYD